MKITNPTFRKTSLIIGSDRFFWAIVGLFVLSASWIALSGRYPMAFDEDFHLGIIRLYAHHPNPFWDGLPAGGGTFGAVARDPSFLYHYLMSFPHRLIAQFISDQYVQVIFLRAINIGLFAGSLLIYRRLMLRTRVSKSIIHLCLLLFVLVPITPLLAAQINYDNLFIPLVGLSLLLTLRLFSHINNKKIDVLCLLELIAACLAASLVKYAYLPILVVIFVYVLVYLNKKIASMSSFKEALILGWSTATKPALAALILLNILLGGLFFERYGLNLLQYHKPVADCGEVLDYEHCQNYGPWIRDYNFKINKTKTDTNPLAFSQHWLYGLWFRSFFAVDGPTTGFQTRKPLLLPGTVAATFAIVGGFMFAISAKKIWGKYYRPTLWLLLWSSAIYASALWLEEYRLFTETGVPVAINGRYLLPILPFIILFVGLGVHSLLAKRANLELTIISLAVACFAWGGGSLTYILRSNDSWYWPNNNRMNSLNHAVKNALGPVTPGYKNNVDIKN